MTELEAYAQIERYLTGEMPAREAADFEAQLRLDPVLARQAREFEELTTALQQHGRRQEVKKKLNAIHAEMMQQEAPMFISESEPISETAETAEPILPKWRVFWNAH